MPKKPDPFREHVEDLGNNKWKCKFCGTESRAGAPRIRAHLAGIPNLGIKVCEKVDPRVKEAALQKIKDKGSMLDISTGGTSGEGTERTVFGTSQSVLPSDDASNPNDAQDSNRPGCVSQQPSCYRSTRNGSASACPQDQVSLPPGGMPRDNLDASQQPILSSNWLDEARNCEIAPPLQQLPVNWWPSSFLDLSELSALSELEFGDDVLPTPLLSNITTTGIPQYSNEQCLFFDEQFADGITPDPPLHSMDWSNHHRSLPENPLESRDVIANTSEEIQTNELHNPTVGSSSQIDSSLDVDSANRLQDCGQPCVVEAVPVRSNTSPTDIVQHPGQLPPRRDKEDGNDIRRFPLRAPMEIDPRMASQHSSDSQIFEATIADSLVPEASTNTIGPSSSHDILSDQALMDMEPCIASSSQAPNNAPPPPQICGTGPISPSSLSELYMNEGAAMTSHLNTANNFEEDRALKRKLEQLYSKEAIIRDELEFAASLSLKQPRTEVVNWLANVEKLRNDCPKATTEDCLPQHQQVDILMHEAQDFKRQSKGLFEARRTKDTKLIERNMVGEAFRENTTKILEFLVGNQKSPLGICGMGGVGKTTIMEHIYNRLIDEANYGKVLWITVSQDFSIQKLQDSIWKELELGSNIPQEKDVRKRAAMLCDCLMERGKSTIILDDVWKHFDLKEVGIPVRADGIKLVLTTRSSKVCCQMQCQEMIKIEPLSHEEAECLFSKELGSEVALNMETEAIVKSIVKECAGLPLAVITMARSMQGVTSVFEWKDCLEKLRESDMGQTDMEEEVLRKLKLSYDRLNNLRVQQCFLSCALYPEDARIDKFKLIEFFIDQGLINELKTREKQYDRGLTILNKLENVCLLEDHGKCMKMHDLIRDMALHIMRGTSIVEGMRTMPDEEYWTDALEKVSLMRSNIGEFPLNMSPNCPKLSIFLLSSRYDVVIPDCFFKQLQGLKVLNLSIYRLQELPDSISDLVNLRALLLRCKELRRIPYLGKLRYLRKLDLLHCEKVKAVEGLEMLVNLRYLNLFYTGIKRLSKGTLGALLNLQYLEVKAVNGEDITKLWALETVVCCFEDVDDFNKFVRMAFEKRNNLRNYELHMVQNEWKYYEKFINDSPFPNWERIVHIDIRSHAIVSVGGESSGGGTCILIPQDVRKLIVNNCDGATNLSDMGPLENLEELKIKEWKNLRVLWGGQDEEIIGIHDSPALLLFPSLRLLQLDQCSKLKYLFGHGPKFSLPHLQSIIINGCEEMVGIIVVVTSPPPHPPPAFPSLEHIFVTNCPKMKRVVESEWLPHFPNLRKIDVAWCENMEEIIGGRPPYVPIEEISHESLRVRGCQNMKNLFPHELPIHLQNLQGINVDGYKGMVEIISGVGQGQEGSITTPVNNTPSSSSQSSISLPKLEYLRLSNLPQLKSICEVLINCDSMKFMKVLRGGRDEEIIDIHDSPVPTLARPLFPSLTDLKIFGFSKLKYLFGHGLKFSLPHLRMIAISNCREMVGVTVAVMSPPLHPPPAFPSLKDIHVEYCGKMKRVLESEWLPHFPNLEKITVTLCENMEEIIGGPPPRVLAEKISLKFLGVDRCKNMRKLFPHEWVLHLQNLQCIRVINCPGMVEMISGAGQSQEGSIMTLVNNTHSSSPSSISLPKLNHLELFNVRQLKSICEVPITCDSMAFLKVTACPELNRIPLQLQFRDIEDLPYIEVEGEEKWKTLIWDDPNAQALLQSHLHFRGSHYMLEGRRKRRPLDLDFPFL